MSILKVLNKITPINSACLLKIIQQPTILSCSTNADSNKPPKKPKTVPVPKITLLSNDQVSTTTLEEATRLAKRRDLKLVKIIDKDTKSNRPVYKLITGSEYHEEDLKRRLQKKLERENDTSIKGEKLALISSKIFDHDLQININKISKWLAKRYEVRVVINGDAASSEKMELIYSKIESGLKDIGRILQKRAKGNDVKFQIVPVQPKSEDDSKKEMKIIAAIVGFLFTIKYTASGDNVLGGFRKQ